MIGVSTNFHQKAFGQIIRPIIQLYVSFDKSLRTGTFFTLDQSSLNGPDILKQSSVDEPAQNWDFYDYKNYSDRLVGVNWSRSIEFPYQIQCGVLDAEVSNTDGFFTPLNENSAIGKNNLPARPMRLYAGFGGATEIIPQMVCLSQDMPDVYIDSKTVSYHAVDFLYDICNQPLSQVVNMRDVSADEVIEKILNAYGLAPSQYHLAKGKYKIPFVFFDIGENAGTALKQLVQSENGFMWLDEKGIVRFETSSRMAGESTISLVLSDYDIIELAPGDFSDIINHVRVNADMREIQEWQEVYVKNDSKETVSDSLWVIPPNSHTEVRCGLSDPCYDIVAPVLGKSSAVSWFTVIDEHMNDISSGVTATGVLTSNAYIVTFRNNHSFPVEINEMKLWGEPAKVYNVLEYEAYDDESLEKYGDHLLEITDNQFFQSYDQADSYARMIIGQKKDYKRTIKVSIKGDFALQLMDMIKIDTEAQPNYNGVYYVLGVSYSYENNNLITEVILNGSSIKPGAFTLNISKLNGEDLIQ